MENSEMVLDHDLLDEAALEQVAAGRARLAIWAFNALRAGAATAGAWVADQLFGD